MTSMVYEREYLHVVWVYVGARTSGWKKSRYFFIFLFFFLDLRDERFIFVSSSFRRAEIDNGKNYEILLFACYTHNIYGWSKFLALLHVTIWIWIEIKSQLISIINDWCDECYCIDLERNWKANNSYYIILTNGPRIY
jgi:hypothetical protein